MADSESDILLSRFRPEQKARLTADLMRENELLQEYIEIGKLDFWFQDLLASTGSQTSGSIPDSGDNEANNLASVGSKARLTWV